MSAAKAVLFDLDGTLVDTAPDFVDIIHTLCQSDAIPAPTETAIRAQVSEGASAMVRLIHPELAIDDAALQNYRQRFLDTYATQIGQKAQFYPGIEVLLLDLEARNIPWGIVTNKPRTLTEKLLTVLGLTKRCSVVVCPEDVRFTKPDPEPMQLAATQLGIKPQHIIYVGDHPRDIEAGQRAHMRTIAAGYGYLSPHSPDLTTWGATWQAGTVAQVHELIKQALAS